MIVLHCNPTTTHICLDLNLNSLSSTRHTVRAFPNTALRCLSMSGFRDTGGRQGGVQLEGDLHEESRKGLACGCITIYWAYVELYLVQCVIKTACLQWKGKYTQIAYKQVSKVFNQSQSIWFLFSYDQIKTKEIQKKDRKMFDAHMHRGVQHGWNLVCCLLKFKQIDSEIHIQNFFLLLTWDSLKINS